MTEESNTEEGNLLLTQAERDRIAAQLREKGATNACELCGHPHWQVNGRLFTFHPLERTADGFRFLSRGAAPVSFLIHCKNCGNTKAMNLNIIGLGDLVAGPEVF